MELSIIIVSYNTAKLLEQVIESIFTATTKNHAFQQQLELLVVDNNSTDDSLATLKQLKKTAPIPVSIIANSVNAGFATANNQAILRAQGKYILLLNSDTVIQPEALEKLIEAMRSNQSKTLGIVAASLINEDGTPQPQGGDLPSLTSLFVFAFMLDDLPLIGRLLPSHQHTGRRFQPPKKNQLQQKGWVAGTAMMLRSELIPQLGVLDENIFMYAEDIEYCWRARKAGWQVAVQPEATIIHLGSQSSSSTQALAGEFSSLRYVLTKHLPKWQIGIGQFLLKLAALNRVLLFSLLMNSTKAKLYQTILHRW